MIPHIPTRCPKCKRYWTQAEAIEDHCIECARTDRKDEKEAA